MDEYDRTGHPSGRGALNDSKTEASMNPVGRTRRWRPSLPQVVFLLVVAATVSWRHKTYFTGGLDPVIVAKGVLSVIALALAWHARLIGIWT